MKNARLPVKCVGSGEYVEHLSARLPDPMINILLFALSHVSPSSRLSIQNDSFIKPKNKIKMADSLPNGTTERLRLRKYPVTQGSMR